MSPVLQTQLPPDFWADGVAPRLPGVSPLVPENWLLVDDAFAGQMAERDQMIADRRDQVLMLDGSGQDAAQELLQLVLAFLGNQPGYDVDRSRVIRPDGVLVPIDRDDPLACAGRLVQEDLCLMQKSGDQHILTGAVLCFPAQWTLAQKFMRPLVTIHTPIRVYDENIARRVQRMFDAIRPERPLMRFNLSHHHDVDLFTPRLETDTPAKIGPDAPYVRVERQCMLRLPDSQAVVFSIHTYLVKMLDLPSAQQVAIGGASAQSGAAS